MAPKRNSAAWIAERLLRVGSRGQSRVIVRLGKPEQVTDAAWKCPVEIIRGRKVKSLDIHGVDAFQSLIVALDFIRDELNQDGRVLTWEGGGTGDPGFPLVVPQCFGRDFSIKLEKMVETKANRYAATIARRRKKLESGIDVGTKPIGPAKKR